MTRSGNDMERTRIARRVLAYAGWAMAAWIVIAYLTTVPAIDRRLTAADANPLAHAAIAVFLVVVLLTALVLWGAALWHAIADPERHLVPRGLLIAVLVFGNFVAGFFYYFFFVHWLPDRMGTGGRSPAPSPRG